MPWLGGPDVENEGVAVEDVEAAHQALLDAGTMTQEQADERLEAWKKYQAEGLKEREDSRSAWPAHRGGMSWFYLYISMDTYDRNSA